MSIDKLVEVNCNEDLIRNGLTRSCESLGFFLKEKVELEALEFTDAKPGDIHAAAESGGKEIILFSEIIGQISGHCFFLLNQKEADLLFRKNFTANQTDTRQRQIFDAFLLELDNIITASVVTEFANYLQVKIFGGIPDIIYHQEESRLKDLVRKTEDGIFTINFRCQYKIQGLEFSPMFFWVFESKFVDIINARCK